MPTPNLGALRAAADRLDELKLNYAFVGGSVVNRPLDDPYFLPANVINARFDQGIAQLKAFDPPATFIVDSLTDRQPNLVRLLQLRNGLDHTPKRTVVQNFHMTAEHLQLPKWSSDGEQAVPLVPEMIKIIGTIIDLAEV